MASNAQNAVRESGPSSGGSTSAATAIAGAIESATAARMFAARRSPDVRMMMPARASTFH